MPAGIGYPTTPPGLESIIQALAIGGQPLGNISRLPGPLGAEGSPQPGLPPITPNAVQPPVPGLEGVTQDQLALILQALTSQGLFNGPGQI